MRGKSCVPYSQATATREQTTKVEITRRRVALEIARGRDVRQGRCCAIHASTRCVRVVGSSRRFCPERVAGQRAYPPASFPTPRAVAATHAHDRRAQPERERERELRIYIYSGFCAFLCEILRRIKHLARRAREPCNVSRSASAQFIGTISVRAQWVSGFGSGDDQLWIVRLGLRRCSTYVISRFQSFLYKSPFFR